MLVHFRFAECIQRPLDVADGGRRQILLHGLVENGILDDDAENLLGLGPVKQTNKTQN